MNSTHFAMAEHTQADVPGIQKVEQATRRSHYNVHSRLPQESCLHLPLGPTKADYCPQTKESLQGATCSCHLLRQLPACCRLYREKRLRHFYAA